MPNSILQLDSITSEDISEVGFNFASYSLLNQNGALLPRGFILTSQFWTRILKEITPLMLTAASGQKMPTNKADFFSDLGLLVLKSFDFDKALKPQAQSFEKKLKFPLTITAHVEATNNLELKTFEAILFSRRELLPALKKTFLSFLNPSLMHEVSKESLESLSIRLSLIEKPSAQLSGKIIVTKGHSGRAKILTQWGEYHQGWTNDLLVVPLSTFTEESYDQSLQERQIVLKAEKYTAIAVPKQFQFIRKLDPESTEELIRLVKRLSSKISTNFELKFSISDSKVFITDILVNQDVDKRTLETRLVDFLTLYKKATPLVAGIRSGPLRSVASKSDLKKIRRGEVVALKYFDKRILPLLHKASGLVLENTASLTHEQIAALSHYGKTSVSGHLENLRNKVITIDGKNGKVYIGAFPPPYTKTFELTQTLVTEPEFKHATTLFAKIRSIGELKNLDGQAVSGYLLNYSSSIESVILTIGHEHKPIIVQTDNKSFEKSIELVKQLRTKKGLTNLYLSLPATMTIQEFRQAKNLLSTKGLHRGGSFKLFCDIATPSAALGFSDIISVGIDGTIIDFHSLASKVYGKNFTSEELRNFDEKSVSILLNQILKLTAENKLYSILSNTPVDKQDLHEAIKHGLKGLAVEAQQISVTQKTLANIEKQLLN